MSCSSGQFLFVSNNCNWCTTLTSCTSVKPFSSCSNYYDWCATTLCHAPVGNSSLCKHCDWSTTLCLVSVSNDPSLYTCNSTGGYTFLPRNDTYPDNCGHYVECVNGKGIPRECANGTHLAYGKNAVMACYHAWDDSTFCRQMRLAQTCQHLGQDSKDN